VSFQFSKHYTVEEARGLLPLVKTWLDQIQSIEERLSKTNARLNSLCSSGNDVGGETVNSSLKLQAELMAVFQEFSTRGIQIKDSERGLIDFPAIRNGKEILLCWEKGEADIEFWHDLESGFPGREPLD
jgi:hypothetical protein